MTSQRAQGALPSTESTEDDLDLSSGVGATRDSLTIGKWTFVSRATGMVRVILIGAVLGPTALGNSYQLTNSLPNLVYYGFLAGSLFSTVLVPAIVGHLDRGDRAATARVAGGFLGVAAVALSIVAPVAVVLLPEALRVVGIGAHGAPISDQVSLSRWLVVMVMPQILGYAVIGTSMAAMNARRRFALAAAAPALENVAIIAVLILAGSLFGGDASGGAVPTAELLLLGLGSTAAVALHAFVQWIGAHRCGITLRPRAGWRDPEVLAVVRRAVPALGQSGLAAAQILVLLLVASRVAGGTVAMQIALNFYALPIALVATPVGLSLLPRLSRLHEREDTDNFGKAYTHGLGLVLLLTVPAACGYLVLAGPLAHVVAAGQMDTSTGHAMVTWTLTAVAAGIVGQSLFFVSTQAAYSVGDAQTPFRTMVVQATLCIAVCTVAWTLNGMPVLVIAGVAYSAANLIGGAVLVFKQRHRLTSGTRRLRLSILRVVAGSAVMAAPTAGIAYVVGHHLPSRLGWAFAVCVAGSVGLLIYGVVLTVLRSPELGWVMQSLFRRHYTATHPRGGRA